MGKKSNNLPTFFNGVGRKVGKTDIKLITIKNKTG